MSADFNPQPKPKKPKKERPNRSPFRKMILGEDDYHCRGCGRVSRLTPHHIIYSGQGGADTINNGITLCSTCHDDVHAGMTYKGFRLTGREVMVGILDRLKSELGYRWHDVHESLKRKVG